MQIRFYYLDDQAPGFGNYYCESCAMEARADIEMSWLSKHHACDVCLMES